MGREGCFLLRQDHAPQLQDSAVPFPHPGSLLPAGSLGTLCLCYPVSVSFFNVSLKSGPGCPLPLTCG